MYQYYEIILPGEASRVVGVTSAPMEGDRLEDYHYGIISKTDFDRYDKKPWSKPRSSVAQRYAIMPLLVHLTL